MRSLIATSLSLYRMRKQPAVLWQPWAVAAPGEAPLLSDKFFLSSCLNLLCPDVVLGRALLDCCYVLLALV